MSVLYYPNSRTAVYELASRVERLFSLVPEQDELPRTVFRSESRR